MRGKNIINRVKKILSISIGYSDIEFASKTPQTNYGIFQSQKIFFYIKNCSFKSILKINMAVSSWNKFSELKNNSILLTPKVKEKKQIKQKIEFVK